MEEYLINSPEEMEALGASLAKRLKGNELICLKGELGAGKTTFVKGLAKGLGIKEGYQVRSPTFTIVNEYSTQKGKLIHIDLYRVRDFDYSEFLGEGVVVVEWKEDREDCDLFIEIEITGEEQRRVKLFRRA
ncbi:tRNA (adenosine(37)-N6)-threonylcarbamoyltransferase complex ATPase subunit type 1 TsaE [Hydrogenivirga sp. 128-5-R1-1]|uniref:tRNA (adenosine(37)-N6)-threonylcarbamoyltransferase complex ATPase subunit type 1 TsaE n=1 Tax=Hydrogenivirga sp. 128-5-R1-1 TaxID=392423 RepID=UPI0002D4376F|nr:tRNA (adenosine(37)-N6)-threonylcarbamoyltransferase complex ATPase subunit type 1 TsaE [Hydrogenivirga sp. 128-5-R1-1]